MRDERTAALPSPESDSPGGASEDSFLRAAADAPGMSENESGSAPRGLSLFEGAVVAKRYRLESRLGEGGMGVVWQARHTVTGQGFALKFLKGSTATRHEHVLRFFREARTAAAVNHPNVVRVTDVFELEDRTPVMVMELLDGQTLRAHLSREKRLPVGETARLLLPVISAVKAAHAVGVVHRDLKPDNIFLTNTTDTGSGVKVLDFGVARFAAPDEGDSGEGFSTETGALLGTAAYMAPEQALAEKRVDHRADVWALGVILYECLAGKRPLSGSSVGQVVADLMGRGIEPLDVAAPELPRNVATVVNRMLSRDASARPDLDEVVRVLEGGKSATQPTPAGRGTRSDGRRRRNVVVALVLFALGGAGYGLLRGRAEEEPSRPGAVPARVALPPQANSAVVTEPLPPPDPSPPASASPPRPRKVAASAAPSKPTSSAAPSSTSAEPPRVPARKGLVDGVPF